MSNTEIASYVSVAALVVSLLAIALSLAFFWITYKVSRNTERAAEGIEMSIDKVEKIYDGLVHKFISTIDEILADYSKHAWSGKVTEEDFSEQVEKKADEKFEEIRKEMSERIRAEISRKTSKTDAQVKELQDSMEKLLDEAITESREVEKDTALETMKNRMLTELLDLHKEGRENISLVFFYNLLNRPNRKVYNAAFHDLLSENSVRTFSSVGEKSFLDDMVSLTEKGVKRAQEIEYRMEYERAP